MIRLENPLEAWMGDIPSEWKKIRLKYLFQIKKDIAGRNGITVLSVTQQGIIPKDMDAKGQFASDYSKYQTVDKGDFVMNHMDLLTGWVDISEYDGVTSPDYRVFECIESSKICAEYYKYLFQLCYKNRIFYGLGQGVSGFGRWRLPADMFLNFVLPIPELSIQKRIADYLHCNISGIDSVIEGSKKTIQEYYELRNSIITEIITKGVNESKEYQKTGKLWMPTIPSSYKLAKLKNLVDITDGTHDTPSYVDVGENTFPLVTSRCIEDGYINLSLANHISYEDYIEINKRSYVNKYDVIMPMIGTVGNPALVRTDSKFAIKNVALFRTHGNECLGKYVVYLLNSNIIKTQFELGQRGGVQNFVSQDRLKNLVIPIPSDVTSIVNELDLKCEKINALINEKKDLLVELEAYKKTLIYEVITGKKEV